MFFLQMNRERGRTSGVPSPPEDGGTSSILNAMDFFIIKQPDPLISQIYFVKKLYMFRAVPLSIIRSFSLYIRHWYMSCRFDGSF
jgi:hypothetical protein